MPMHVKKGHISMFIMDGLDFVGLFISLYFRAGLMLRKSFQTTFLQQVMLIVFNDILFIWSNKLVRSGSKGSKGNFDNLWFSRVWFFRCFGVYHNENGSRWRQWRVFWVRQKILMFLQSFWWYPKDFTQLVYLKFTANFGGYLSSLDFTLFTSFTSHF